MRLKEALEIHKNTQGKTDILELVGNTLSDDIKDIPYYEKKIENMPQGKYFLSDLDGTFFRGMLQKEAVSIFIKIIKKTDPALFSPEAYYKFLQDYKLFTQLEKNAYNKEISYSLYLNAGIFLLMTHHTLISWDKYVLEIQRIFEKREKVTPYRFSLQKMKDILLSGNNFLFISGAPHFIFEIYLIVLKKYLKEQLQTDVTHHIYGVSSLVNIHNNTVVPLWGATHKSNLITILKKKGIISETIGGMGDTKSDFGISSMLHKNNDFYFVNPEKKVLNMLDKNNHDNCNYHIIIERKDVVCTIKKENITLL